MGTTYRDIEVAQLADWLADQPDEHLWGVEGEWQISGELPLPCEGSKLAQVLKKRNNRLRVFFTPKVSPTGPVSDIESLAGKEEDGGLLFEVAWLEGDQPGERWLLVEDTLAEEIEREARLSN